jgi:4-amino-4-deoxy-L-arabinose transferase-like glycosyltransferase
VGAAALAVRVGYVLIAKRTDGDITDEGDAFYYSAQAYANAHGRFFQHPFFGGPAADHPPLTALLLTPISWLSDDGILAERLFMTLVGTAAVLAIMWLATDVGGRKVGVVAGVLAAVNAGFWVNDGLLMSESLTTLLVALVLLAAFRFARAPDARHAVVLGAVCGLGVLARAELALLVPLLLVPLALLARSVEVRRRVGIAVLAAVTAGLVVAPWVVWNLTRFEKPVLLSTNDGLTLLGANCDSTYHGAGIGLWSLVCAIDVPPSKEESVVAAESRDRAFTYIGDHLGELPKVAVVRFARAWSLYAPGQMAEYRRGEGLETSVSWTATIMYWALLPLAAVGVVTARRRGVLLLPFVATAVLVTLTAIAFYGIVRFRLPADVSIVVLAALGVDALVPKGARRARRAGVARRAA